MMERPRLLHRLQAALQAGHVYVVAPAGYGKTVLLRTLSARQPHAHYLALEPADADLSHLQKRLAAVQQAPDEDAQTTLMLDDAHYLSGLCGGCSRSHVSRFMCHARCSAVFRSPLSPPSSSPPPPAPPS